MGTQLMPFSSKYCEKKEKNIFFLVNSSLTLWLLFCSEKAPTSRGMEACWNCGFWYTLLDFLKLLAKIWIWSYIIFCSIFNTITCLFERNERENDIYKLSVKQPIYKLYSDNYGWFFGRNLGGSLLLDLSVKVLQTDCLNDKENIQHLVQVGCMEKHQGTQYLVFLQIYIVGRQLSIKWCYCVVYFGKLNLQCESHNTNRYSTVKKNRQYTWEYLDLKRDT